jgi:hypothetical protein
VIAWDRWELQFSVVVLVLILKLIHTGIFPRIFREFSENFLRLTASKITPSTYDDLIPSLLNELDYPHRSWSTGK